MAGKVRVAAVQMTSGVGQEEKNLSRVIKAIGESARNGAKLVVFPEGMNNGYIFSDAQQAYEMATTIPGPFTDALSRKAKETGTYVAIGILEKAPGTRIFNNSILISPQGTIIARHQKKFFIKADKHWMVCGNDTYPVVETEIGRIGFFICAEGRIPENARITALKGADILLNTSNWGGPDQYLSHVPTRCVENRCWVVGVTKIGEEPGNKYTGHSFIMDPKGNVLAQAGGSEEEIIYAEIEPLTARDKTLGDSNDIFRDRVPKAYGILNRPYDALPLAKVLREAIVPDEMNVQAAVVQLSFLGDFDTTLQAAMTELREVKHKYIADMVVFPELFLFDRDRIADAPALYARQSLQALSALSGLAAELDIYVAASLVEEERGNYYSSAYLVGPSGIVGRYRKVHLWGRERDWATAGSEFPVFATRYGNVGMMLGYDGRFPEAARCLAAAGADAVLWPTSWAEECEFRYIAPERALENKVFIVAANRLDSVCDGPSMIIKPLGYPITTLTIEMPHQKKGFISRMCDLSSSRSKRIIRNTDLFAGRRPELYGPLTAADPSA